MKNIIISVILYIGINATFPILESNAQVRHITGTVTNSKTGISIPNITVRIKNTNLITTTDKAGKYKLEVPDVIRSIEFSNFEGMEVRSVDLVSDSIINIKLSGDIKGLFDLSLAELLNLKITTAGRKEEKIADIPANVIIITREEIEKYGYLNFREILENVPGIYITEERNDGQVGVNIRGYWKDMTRNVIIMINSVPQLFNIMKSYPVGILNVPVESIERIEIIKGPMSVIYGSGAFFGAINIITNTKEIGSSTSLVSISAGNNCAKKTVARVAIYKNDISLNINGALFETKGEDIEYNSMMTNPGSLINKTTGTDAYRIKSKFFNLSASFKDFYSEISYTESNAGGSYLTPPFENDRRSTVFNSMRFVFGYKKEITEWLKINANIRLQNLHSQGEIKVLSADERGFTQNNDKDYNIGLNIFINPDTKLKITIGGDYKSNYEANQQNNVIPLGFQNTYHLLDKNEKLESYNVFTQINYRLFSKLELVAGLRIEQELGYGLVNNFNTGLNNEFEAKGLVPDGDINLIPRFAVVFALNKNNVFKVLYGKAIMQPPLINNNDIVMFNEFNSIEVPYLDAETIETIEINYMSVFFSKLTANISFFRNNLKNLIVRKSVIINNFFTPYSANGGELITNGFEISLLAKPIDDLSIDLSFTWQNSEDQNNKDIDISFSPSILAYTKLSYKFPNIGKPNRNLIILSLTGNYVDEMYSHFDNSPDISSPIADPEHPDYIPVGRIGEKTKAYYVLGTNLRVSNLFIKGLFLNFRVSNLLDTKIHYPTYDNNRWADKGIPGYGRRFLLSMGYKF